MAVTKAERTWREWFLGEGRFSQDGRRNPTTRPDVPKAIPALWWKRLEAFLAKRSDYSEPGRKGGTPGPTAPAPAGQLTAHFNVREFDCHNGQRVPAIAVPALTRLCKQILEPMRAEFGACHVLSGYRPEAYNRAIGGARYSQHIYELTSDSVAADLTFARGDPAMWAVFADRMGAGGVGRYNRSGFCHVDNRPEKARWTG